MRISAESGILPLIAVAIMAVAACSKPYVNPENPDAPHAVTVEPEEGATIYGQVSCDGAGLEGVVVTDGYDVASTDADGVYQLFSGKRNRMVWISIPSGYMPRLAGVQAMFYDYLKDAPDVPERHDFILDRDGDQTDHKMLFFGDMHLADRTRDLSQFAVFTKEIDAYVSAHGNERIYAMTLGDMAWDAYWYTNKYTLSEYLRDINAGIGQLTVFHTVGNHDHDMRTSVNGSTEGWAAVDWDVLGAYRSILGPNYYSFNIGKVHYVSLDNIFCKNTTGGETDDRHYEDRVSDDALAWLKKDLKYVDRETPVVIAMHAPYCNQNGSLSLDNGGALTGALAGRTDVLFVTGHTHRMSTAVTQGMREHNSGAVCAAWWWCGRYNETLNISTDGSPSGYRVMDFSGKTCESYYKAVGRPAEYQFRTYDRNCVCINPAGVKYETEFSAYLKSHGGYSAPSTANEVLINVWDWNEGWKVEVSENGVSLPVARVSAYDPLFLSAYSAYRFDATSKPTFDAFQTNHFFKVTASAPDSALEIKVTDDEGRIYSESMSRPKEFSLDMYR